MGGGSCSFIKDLYGTAGMTTLNILLMSASHLIVLFLAAQTTLCVSETLFLLLSIESTQSSEENNKYKHNKTQTLTVAL